MANTPINCATDECFSIVITFEEPVLLRSVCKDPTNDYDDNEITLIMGEYTLGGTGV